MTILFQYPALQEPVFTPVVETITEDKWHQPYPIPTRRPYNTALYLAASNWSDLKPPAVETITLDKWYQDLSPVTRRKFATTDYVVADTDPANFSGTPIAPTGWLGDLSAPQRLLGLPTAAQGFMESIANANPPETITEDKWHQIWVIPTRRVYNRALYLEASQAPTRIITNEVVTMDKWYVDFPPPTRRKFDTARFIPALTTPYKAIVPETITVDKWYQDLSRQIWPRQRPLMAAAMPSDVVEESPLPNPNISGYLPLLGTG